MYCAYITGLLFYVTWPGLPRIRASRARAPVKQHMRRASGVAACVPAEQFAFALNPFESFDMTVVILSTTPTRAVAVPWERWATSQRQARERTRDGVATSIRCGPPAVTFYSGA